MLQSENKLFQVGKLLECKNFFPPSRRYCCYCCCYLLPFRHGIHDQEAGEVGKYKENRDLEAVDGHCRLPGLKVQNYQN